MSAYYNEIDPFCIEWLKNLIKKNLIADGDVDGRSIADVQSNDLKGYDQCHFFAGIGLWSYALRQAGVDDTEPVWTGSCPCQPFSTAGRQKGKEDERHLWPTWFRLIRECKPPVIFGEQVAAAIGHGWLDLVQSDLEGENYAVGKAVLGACSVGAPHIRQRLYFVADTRQKQRGWRENKFESFIPNTTIGSQETIHNQRCGTTEQLADTAELRRSEQRRAANIALQRERTKRGGKYEESEYDGQLSGRLEGLCWSGVVVGDTFNPRLEGHTGNEPGRLTADEIGPIGAASCNGFWTGADWVYCRDKKYRPVEPGTFPLAHGVANRVGKLRAYGNAIVLQVAAEFIRAFREIS